MATHDVTQYAADSWYYTWDAVENPPVRDNDLKTGYMSAVDPDLWGAARLIFDAPTYPKKAIAFDSIKLYLYFTRIISHYPNYGINIRYVNGQQLANIVASIIHAYGNVSFSFNPVTRYMAYRLFSTGLDDDGLLLMAGSLGDGTPASLPDYYQMSSSRASSNKPYLKYTASDIVPEISNISPQAGNIDGAVQNVFTYTFAIPAVDTNLYYLHQSPVFAEGEMQWKLYGDGTLHTVNSSQNGRFTIPADTFTNDTTIQWRMRAKTDDDVYSDWSDWYTLAVGDVDISGTPISPASQYLDATKPVTFEWTYSSGLGRPQAAFEAEVSYDGGETFSELFSGSGTDTSYVLPADTLIGGTMIWRIRVQNDRGTWSDWSDGLQNSVVAALTTPVINAVDGSTARPVITWQIHGQLAFQLDLRTLDGTLIYESGTINSNLTEHKIGALLEDGQYIVRVRCQNEYLLWSEWGAVNVFVETVKPAVPSLAVQSIENGVRLSFSDVDETATSLIVYRNGQPIAQLEPDVTQWDDYSSVGECEYMLRLLAGDVFEDSESMSVAPNIKGRLIAAVSDLSNPIDLRYRQGERPARNFSYQPGVVLTKFEGRRRPCADRADAAQLTLSFDASAYTSTGVFDRLIELADTKQTVLYRDSKGKKLYGQINNINGVEKARLTDISLSLMAIDYDEVIDIA
jgi:hypothetical protein